MVAQQRAMHTLYHMYIVAVVLLPPASIVAVNLPDISSCDFCLGTEVPRHNAGIDRPTDRG